MGFEVGDTQKLEAQYEKLTQKLSGLVKKQSELNKTDLSGVTKNIGNIGDSISKTIKKIGRWVLAVFAIESAYGAVRRAMSTLTQYNSQIKADLDYIGFAMATALQPIVEALIGLMYKLMTYVGYLAKAWFGVDIWANSSAEAFKKADKSAKSLKKTTAGFDEMNIISSGNTGTTTGTPNTNLAAPTDTPIPSWLVWIKDNGLAVASIITAIGGALVAFSFGASILIGLGIGLLLAGIVVLVKGIIDFIKDPSWENFLTILQGIALIVAGIALLCGAWVVALIALGVSIVAYVIKNWDKVKEIFSAIGGWIYDKVIKPVADFFAGLWNGLSSGAKVAWDKIKSIFSVVGSFFGGIFSTIKTIFKNIGQTIGDVIGNAFKTAINAILSLADTIINAPIRGINKLIDTINKVPGINLGRLSEIKIPRLASGGIINQPNRGIPVGSAIGGESGSEGVIPLTDSQAMATLGEAIGKYITINNMIDNYMDGRKINRILAESKNKSGFANNG